MGWRADNLDREYVDIEATKTLSAARSSCAVVGQSLEFFVLSLNPWMGRRFDRRVNRENAF